MSIFTQASDIWKFNRDRTVATLDEISQQPDPKLVLGWRPAPGRAHIAWQLMHIAITEELFATERLVGTTSEHADLIRRFKGGSTPDDEIPTATQIRDHLDQSREHLLNTVSTFNEADLSVVPEAFRERGWTLETILKIIAWHESHHQGQTHITWNLWKAAHG